jgi:D-beta-D-heptose 7-phosphate kinase/D-beta-D-heptose 1-phosphate adenosyltransferase
MLDRYIRGEVDRLSPEAPIQILDVAEESALLGGAANVAMKAMDLGAHLHLVGAVGDDGPGEEIRALLRERSPAVDGLIAVPSRPTTVKTRLIAHNQQLLRVDREQRTPFPEAARDLLVAAAFEAASKADVVILEDYGKGVLSREVIGAALAGAGKRSIPVIVDPNGRDYRRYAGVTVLTPNLRETEIAAGRSIKDEAGLQAAAEMLVDQTRGAALAVTRESEGISLFRDQGQAVTHTRIPTVPVAVYDVTGAGDAVVASLAISLACGIALEEACGVANLAGRAIVRQFGVGTLSIDRLLDEIAECAGRPEAKKVVKAPEAVKRLAEVRRGGGKVVFTNGCFDILHFGHAYLLQFARAQGDFLVLGLNSDASIRRLKGPDRPFVEGSQRAHMLSLYPFVDLVVEFDEDTPLELLEALRPDILVKGGDYTPETVVGRELVESSNGKVVICPRLEGLSTTDIVKKIHERRS